MASTIHSCLGESSCIWLSHVRYSVHIGRVKVSWLLSSSPQHVMHAGRMRNSQRSKGFLRVRHPLPDIGTEWCRWCLEPPTNNKPSRRNTTLGNFPAQDDRRICRFPLARRKQGHTTSRTMRLVYKTAKPGWKLLPRPFYSYNLDGRAPLFRSSPLAPSSVS